MRLQTGKALSLIANHYCNEYNNFFRFEHTKVLASEPKLENSTR